MTPEATSDNCVIRKATKDDLAFIYSTWLRSFRYSSDFAKDITNDVYYEMHHQVIDRILARGATVLVAVEREHPEVLFGYLVGEGPVAHFAYVKKPFRMLCIGTALLKAYPNPIKFISHLTKDGKKFLEVHKEIRYNPYYV